MKHRKKAYRKVILREVRYTLSRFLAIFAIVAIGVGFLAGLLASTPDMRLTADAYYDDADMMDLRVLSTLGLSDDDIAAIRETEGVAAVMPAYSADVLVEAMDASNVVARIHSLPLGQLDDTQGGYQNRVSLVSGRMPEEPGECVVLRTKTLSGVEAGDVITLSADNSDLTEVLAAPSFTVVGFVETPYYMSIEDESSTIGAGRVQLTLYTGEESFAYPAWTEAFVLVEGAGALNTFYDEYEDLVGTAQDHIETLAQTQAVVRYDTIVAEAEDKLAKGQKEYDDAKAEADKELADALQELEDGRKQLEDGEKQLADSKQETADGKQQLEDAKQKLEEGREELAAQKEAYAATIEEQEQQLADAQKEYDDGKAKLDAAKEELDAAKAAIDEAEQTLAYLQSIGQTEAAAQIEAQLAQQKPAYEAALAAYTENAAVLEQAAAELQAGQEALEAGKQQAQAEFDAAQRELDEGQAEIDANEQKIADAEKQIADAEKTLADSRQELEDGQAEYDKAKAEADEKLADAQAELEDARQAIADIDQPEWYVLDRNTNVSYVSFESNASKVEAIAKVFPIFFFLVAALVALTTMTRMVEEERTQIGVLKALGYTRGAIAFKYLLYAGSASILGSVFGLLVGFKVFPTVIWNAYGIMYTLPPIITAFHVPFALASSLAAIFCTMAATLSACIGSLKETPARLMLPRAPKAGKRVFLEYITPLWSRLKFTQKVTARNLIRYKKRFFMTVIGIAGCTALLLTGFGLRDSIGDIVDKQFGELYQYNLIVSLHDSDALQKDAALAAAVQDSGQLTGSLLTAQETGDLYAGDNTTSATLFVPQESQRLQDFVTLRDRRSGDAIPFTDDKVLLTEKQASVLGVKAGDTIEVRNADGQSATFTLGGVIENYVDGTLYIPPALYTAAFGEPEYLTLIGTTPEGTTAEERDALATTLLACEEVQSVSMTDDIQTTFANMVNNINYIVIVLIISAAALAFVVLYNLTNINITERQKELATIKVLGFYDREVSAYIYRETAILTIIGAAVGLVLGIFLHAFVVRTAEVDMVMFGREIKWLSYVISAAMTLFFSFLVNLVMGRKMKKIDMVESMKAGE